MHSQATVDAILDLHEQGKPLAAICQATGVSRTTVMNIIKQRVRMNRAPGRIEEDRPRMQPYNWCPNCRAKVQMPCIACRTRKAMAMKKKMAWLRSYAAQYCPKTPSDSTPAGGP